MYYTGPPQGTVKSDIGAQHGPKSYRAQLSTLACISATIRATDCSRPYFHARRRAERPAQIEGSRDGAGDSKHRLVWFSTEPTGWTSEPLHLDLGAVSQEKFWLTFHPIQSFSALCRLLETPRILVLHQRPFALPETVCSCLGGEPAWRQPVSFQQNCRGNTSFFPLRDRSGPL